MFFPSLCIPLNAQPMSVSLRMANLKSFPPRHPKWLRLHSSQSLQKSFVSACFSGKPARSIQCCACCAVILLFRTCATNEAHDARSPKNLRYEWLVSPSNPLSALELRITSNPRKKPKQCHLVWVETRAGLVSSCFVKITHPNSGFSKLAPQSSKNWSFSILFLDFFWNTLNKLIWLVTRRAGQDSQYLRMACISSNIHDFKLASLASLRFPDGQKDCRKHLDQHGPTHGQTVTTNNNELHMLTGRMRLGHLFLRNLYNLYIYNYIYTYTRFQTLLSALYRFST